jgi:hypothetical protein
LQNDFSAGKMTAPICKAISPPEKRLLPFVKRFLRRINGFASLCGGLQICKTTFPPEK